MGTMNFIKRALKAIARQWKLLVGVLISAVFLYYSLSKLEWEGFWEALRTANYIWIIPGVAVYFVGVWVRAWRWHYLLRPIKAVPTRVMFPIVAIGYMGNNIYPARAGEVLRAVVLKRREGVPISASLATVIVERIFDGVVMLAFIFVNLAELSRLTNVPIELFGVKISIQSLAIGGSALFFGALAVFLLAAMFPRISERVIEWGVQHFVPQKMRLKVLDVSRRFLGGLESLRSPVEALMVFFTSVVIWLLETGKYWFVMHAFGFEVSFFTLMLMNGIVNLATTLPGAPGYVGTFDTPGIETLVAYGVAREIAAGYTIVLHIALWVPITVLGGYYLAKEGVKWQNAIQEAEQQKEVIPTAAGESNIS